MPPYAVRVRTATGWQDIALQGKSIAVFEQPDEPMTAVNGDIWIDTDAPTPAATVSLYVQQGHTWAIDGAVAAKTLPGFFIAVPAGQTCKIVSARGKIHAGASSTATVYLQRNGGSLASSRIVQQSTAVTWTYNQAVVTGDIIELAIASVTGSPVGMSFTVFLEFASI